eukprot:m.726294 g.726294  ORF g.726294 m.726294 type:complete len:333 (+) comp58854_c0_seq15:100-1098(+)
MAGLRSVDGVWAALGLSAHLRPDALSHATHARIQTAKEQLRAEKQAYMRQLVVYEELGLLLEDSSVALLSPSAASTLMNSPLVYANASRLLVVGLAKQHLTLPTADQQSVLAVAPHDLDQDVAHLDKDDVGEQLVPELETRLRRTCEALLRFYDSKVDSEGLTQAKAVQLSALVEMDCKRLQQAHTQLAALTLAALCQFEEYFLVVMETLSVYESMLSTHKLQVQLAHDTLTAKSLAATCHATREKLRMILKQITREIYSKEDLVALQHVRAHLDHETENQEAARASLTHSLQVYASVGRGFDAVVKEYSRLSDSIEAKQWALKEFQEKARR